MSYRPSPSTCQLQKEPRKVIATNIVASASMATKPVWSKKYISVPIINPNLKGISGAYPLGVLGNG
ncbi:hypothetical protein I7I48_05211 [Histoplasma ohiense]|nr:hypothetical protein I7I48_05211 [Histoplasma ohiense (nom. inval.)]